jgi:atypical dual specificity phosphatase
VRQLIAWVLFIPTLLWNLLLGRVLHVRHWWDRIDDHVFMGALPLSWDVPRMKQEGIGAVVNTCSEYAGPQKAYAEADIVQLRLPTVDFTPPSLADVERGVAFMEEQIADGRDVYVHCKAGRARSATIVLCWLIAAKGVTPEEGQKWILEKRPHAHRHLVQRQVVQEFWKKHGGGEGVTG